MKTTTPTVNMTGETVVLIMLTLVIVRNVNAWIQLILDVNILIGKMMITAMMKTMMTIAIMMEVIAVVMMLIRLIVRNVCAWILPIQHHQLQTHQQQHQQILLRKWIGVISHNVSLLAQI